MLAKLYSLWILNLCLIVICMQPRDFVSAEVVLSPLTAVVSENNSLTLTCTYSADETVTYVTWSVFRKSEGTSTTIGIITADCTEVINPVDTSLYSYTCPNTKQYTWTITTVTRQNGGNTYRCNVDTPSPGYINSNNATLSVQVPITSVTMIKPSSSSVTLNENTEVEFTCHTSGGLPVASIAWYKDSGTSGDAEDDLEITSGIESTETSTNSLIKVTSILRYSPSRNENGWMIYCTASNVAGQTPIVSGKKPLLNVRYPPRLPVITNYTNGDEYRVIENTQGRLSCTVTGGNPAPALTWNCFNSGGMETSSIGIVTKTQTWIAQRNQDRTCTCKSSHYSGDKTVSIKIEVLYPPSTPSFRIKLITVSGTVKIIKNNHVSVSCISSGNPPPSYTWIYPNMTTRNGEVLSVSNVQNNSKYTCNVRNSMDPSDDAAVPGSNTSFIDVLILYPPTIGHLNNKSVAEGSQVTVSCPVKVGYPSQTTYEWIRDGTVWRRTQMITIDETFRNDAMFYTCKVSNIMQQTGEQPVSQPNTKSFYLNVWYGASVKDFFISGHKGAITVVVNENDPVPFNCNVDSNPGSDISVYYQENVLMSLTDTKSLAYTILSANCTDRGNYSCIGFNDYNENHSSQLLSLLVRCSPRPSPTVTLKQNVTSSQHKPAVFTFTTLAYPEPNNDHFRWYRLEINVWQLLSKGEDFEIETSNGQTNLIIKDVNRTYYGMYKLEISNEVGQYSQPFYLEPEDMPEPPTEFRHVAELVTKTSVTLQWKTGFDNGPDQTFILRYKKVSDNEWISVYIPDTGEEVMNYNITNLSSGIEYEVVLLAFNELGNSSATETLTVKTIDTTKIDKSLITTSIAAGVSSSVVVVVVVVVVGIFIWRKRRNQRGQGCSKPNNCKATTAENLVYSLPGTGLHSSSQVSYEDLQGIRETNLSQTYESLHLSNDEPHEYVALSGKLKRSAAKTINKGSDTVYENLKITT